MLTIVTPDENKAIGRVIVTGDGQKLMLVLERELAARDRENRTTEGEFTPRGQGRSLQLQETILLLDKADPKGF